MGRRSRNISARHQAAEQARRDDPAPLTGREILQALCAQGLAAVNLMVPDAETGAGYVRQWYIPRDQAEAFAATVTRNAGDPVEVMMDADEAARSSTKSILTFGGLGPFEVPEADGEVA